MDVSKNSGASKSSILIGFSIINHPFWGPTPIFGNTHIHIDTTTNASPKFGACGSSTVTTAGSMKCSTSCATKTAQRRRKIPFFEQVLVSRALFQVTKSPNISSASQICINLQQKGV